MGLGTFFKSLFNAEECGDEIIATQERMYRASASEHPDWEPHQVLAHVWLSRMAAIGNDVKSQALQLKAFVDTSQFACLPPPLNARALGLWFIYKERPDILEKYPKFSEEYGRLMLPIFKAKEDGTFPGLYRQFNPEAAKGMQEMESEETQDPF
jgi:hypothetical protein